MAPDDAVGAAGPPPEGPESGILVTRAQAELLVDLGGGPALAVGRDVVVDELLAVGVLQPAPATGPVLAAGMDVLAGVLARPELTLDLHLIAGTERRRSSFLATSEGALRVVQVADGLILTPVKVEELVLRLALEIGLPTDPPPEAPERYTLADEDLGPLLDRGRLPAGADGSDPLFRPFVQPGYVATATTGSATLFWMAGRDGTVSFVRPESDAGSDGHPGPARSVLEQSSGFGVLLALGSMIAPHLPGVELLLPPLRD